MLTVLVIPADIKEPCYLRAIDDGMDRLKAMQAIVGGYIEHVGLDEGVDLWLNEEGKLNGAPLNDRATWMAQGYIFSGDYIAGDVFLTGNDGEGNEVSLGISFCNGIISVLDEYAAGSYR